MFFLTAEEYGHAYHAQIFTTFDDACDALNMLENAQDDSYSYARELAISELKGQILDFMTENQE
jgi:acyl-CoA thioesterase FadM